MAGYNLIDNYLESLRSQLRWRGETDDIDSEIRDHLYTAAERLEAQGMSRPAAEATVLKRFGEPAVVSSAFAANGTTGLAVPTHFTQSIGMAALIGALGWLLVAGGFLASYGAERMTGEWDGAPMALFMMGQLSLLASAALTVATFIGLFKRHGGLGALGALGIGATCLGAAAGIIGWFYYGWGTLIAIGSLLITASVIRRGLAPAWAMILVGVAWLLAGATAVTLQMMEVGPRDQWGDYPLVLVTAVTVGCVFFAAGLGGIGQWLRREDPVGPILAGDTVVG
ncbi:MAG: permease prefix domain 1-containing protein [Acidimicrobiales bacterium]